MGCCGGTDVCAQDNCLYEGSCRSKARGFMRRYAVLALLAEIALHPETFSGSRYASIRFKVGVAVYRTHCTSTIVVKTSGPRMLPSGWISHLGISQAWNIIEGENNSTSVFIFDGVVGTVRSQPFTYIACHTKQSPFGMSTSVEPVIQIHGWTVLHGVWFLWFSWFMGIRRLDRHLSNLRSE